MRPLFLVGAAVFFAVSPALADNDDPKPEPRKEKRAEGTIGAMKALSTRLARTEDNERSKDKSRELLELIVEQTVQAEQQEPEKREVFARAAVDKINGKAVEVEQVPDAPAELLKTVRHGMAEVNLKAGNLGDAENYASRAIDYDPKDRDAYVQRSQATWGQRHYEAAASDAFQAIKLDPQAPDGWRAKAMANYGLGDFLQASEDARRALALDPNDRTAFAILKLTEGRVNKALDMDALKRRVAGEIMGEYHGMLQQLNQAEERRRDSETGKAVAGAEGGEKNPESVLTSGPALEAAHRHVRSAAGSLSVKDYDGAIAAADKALEQDPNNTAAYYYRAAALNLAGRYEDALRDASKALALNSSDAMAHDARAFAFNHLGRYRDAVADSHHSLEINPKNSYAFANLGYSHERMGDLAAMLRDLKAAAAINPQFEPVYNDAAARHGLEVETLSADGAAARASEERLRTAAKRKQFAFVVGSSTVGGLLIALGFIHLFSDRKREAAATKAAKPLTIPSAAKLENAFQIVKTVGSGGMGVVYQAVDRALQRPVAVKVVREELKRDPDAKQRFLEEARTVAGLSHPNIIAIHQIVDDDTGLYLVFEFVEGRTLHDLIAERGRLTLEEAKSVLKPVCAALEYAHRHRVVHRDLKPANIMISPEGEVKVMDFGISRHVRDAAAPTTSEGRTGTPEYMAPEQRYGVVRRESDVFSLAACLYEMVTGRRPFAGQTGSIAGGDYVKATSAAPGLPPSLDALMDAALHPDPERRVRSARDFWSLLERVRSEQVAA